MYKNILTTFIGKAHTARELNLDTLNIIKSVNKATIALKLPYIRYRSLEQLPHVGYRAAVDPIVFYDVHIWWTMCKH